MKKKVFLISGVLLLLVVLFFSGETILSPKERLSEKFVGESQVLQEIEAENTEILTDTAEVPSKEEDPKNQKQTEDSAILKKPQEEDTGQPSGIQDTATFYAEKENVCTLSVRCDAVLENMDSLPEGKESLVPQNGMIYREQQVTFTEGESVFDVLYREMREKKIHFEFVKTPMYNSAYIEGIGNLYEFDCGEYSGWIYRVNGVKPNVGCSQYQVKKGDVIVFSYTCNFLKER